MRVGVNLPIAVVAGTSASDRKLGVWPCGTSAVNGQSCTMSRGVVDCTTMCSVKVVLTALV